MESGLGLTDPQNFVLQGFQGGGAILDAAGVAAAQGEPRVDLPSHEDGVLGRVFKQI